MPQLTLKHTRQGYTSLHPRKSKKKLVRGVSTDNIIADWLKTNGWMTHRRGKPPYKFLHRKKITRIPRRLGIKLKAKIQRRTAKAKLKDKTKMSLAAKKAWETRRKKHH